VAVKELLHWTTFGQVIAKRCHFYGLRCTYFHSTAWI